MMPPVCFLSLKNYFLFSILDCLHANTQAVTTNTTKLAAEIIALHAKVHATHTQPDIINAFILSSYLFVKLFQYSLG